MGHSLCGICNCEPCECRDEYNNHFMATPRVRSTVERVYTMTKDDKQDQKDALYGIECAISLCHGASLRGGWWTDLKTNEPLERNVAEMLCLIHSEISEALEGHRKNLMDDKLPNRTMLEVELADTVIRIFDMAGGLNLDVGGALIEKLKYNATREDHKIEARKLAGGKKI